MPYYWCRQEPYSEVVYKTYGSPDIPLWGIADLLLGYWLDGIRLAVVRALLFPKSGWHLTRVSVQNTFNSSFTSQLHVT